MKSRPTSYSTPTDSIRYSLNIHETGERYAGANHSKVPTPRQTDSVSVLERDRGERARGKGELQFSFLCNIGSQGFLDGMESTKQS